MSVETKKTKANKFSLRDPSFYNIWRRIFLYLVTSIGYMIRYKLVYRLEVKGKENIPKHSDFIIAANHLSTLDPPLICGIMPQGVAYMAKKELFEKMISDEFIDQRFKEFQKEEEGRLQTQTPSKEELERYMLQMRKERIEFEKEQAAKREAIAREKKMGTEQKNDSSENDNLTGKSEK